ALRVPSAAMPGAMAADNLMMAAFLAVLMAVPVRQTASAAEMTAAKAVAAERVGEGSSGVGAAVVVVGGSPETAMYGRRGLSSERGGAAPGVQAEVEGVQRGGACEALIERVGAAAAIGALAGAEDTAHAAETERETIATENAAGRAAPEPNLFEKPLTRTSSAPGWLQQRPPSADTAPSPPQPQSPSAPPVTAESLSLTLAAAAAACAASQHLAAALNAVPLTMTIMALVAAAMSGGAQWLRSRLVTRWSLEGQPAGPVFAGASALGSCLMPLFFAVIGASAGSLHCLAGATAAAVATSAGPHPH
ncbi:hypothetical protein Agub_g4613, partial [Astrephomene gubernaculifera]